jgi:hypothetical protein
MPYLRCNVCDHEAYERSVLAIGSECGECEEGELVEADEDQDEVGTPAATAAAKEPGPRLALPRAAARDLLAARAVAAPPVPVERLAESMGLTIVDRKNLGSLSGRLVDMRIEIAPCSANRRRFVIAHELGHHFLHKPHGSGAHVEAEVNAFAGELLVPGPMLATAVRDTGDLSSLTQRFRVSSQVLEIAARVHHLGDRIG